MKTLPEPRTTLSNAATCKPKGNQETRVGGLSKHLLTPFRRLQREVMKGNEKPHAKFGIVSGVRN